MKNPRKGRPPGAGHLGRIDALTAALHGSGVLHLKDAARVLGVSEMTVRRDVAGVPDRFSNFGGYIVPRTADGPYVMAEEQGTRSAAKAAVSALAAGTVEDGDTIFVDCGTTMPHLARHLAPGLHVTVVCYALNIAVPLSAMPKVRLLLLGGFFNPSSASFSVDDGLATLDRLGINRAFISAGGVHAEKGVSCSNFHEIAVKRAVLRRAVHRTLVVDGSKLGKVRPAPFADLGAFDALVTTDAPDAAAGQVAAIRAAFPGQLLLARAAP
jgi:DeoR family deoxyribose operon repressor